MLPSFVVRIGCVVFGLAALTLSGCSRERSTEHSQSERNDACVVSTVGATPVTLADVTRVRMEFQPPPTWAQASRLAVDATLAHVHSGGDLGPAPIAVRLRSYRT